MSLPKDFPAGMIQRQIMNIPFVNDSESSAKRLMRLRVIRP
jgi:hypothetical protein